MRLWYHACVVIVYTNMKEVLNIRVEISRKEKLRDIAKERKKTMTQLVEDWIDRLPAPKIDSEA